MNHGFENEDKEPMMIHEHREPTKTLRDEFAMAAISGLLSDPQVGADEKTARLAYRMANFLLKAREVE